jgi:hypothetical protein
VLPVEDVQFFFCYDNMRLPRWARLSLYVTDGRLQLDNNNIENAMRPIALGRKNFLFAGSNKGGKRLATTRYY